MEDHFSSL
ncbi:hypothetical protein DMN91_006571, partial [Ooceraea biroi]